MLQLLYSEPRYGSLQFMFSRGKLCKLSRTFKIYNRQFIHFARIPVEFVARLWDLSTQKYNNFSIAAVILGYVVLISQRTMFSCTQHVVLKYTQIWHWFCVFIASLVEAWFKYIVMLCPLNVVLKLNRFVNVTSSFNIRGDYFKARYFSMPLACCFFTNQLTGFFVPLHNVYT